MRFNACRVFFSSIQIVKLLIKKGVYVNERFYSDDSVLHYIVSPKEWEETNASDHIEAVRALIANGADPTLVNNDGKTTFDVAQNETIRAVLVQAVSFLYYSIERIFFLCIIVSCFCILFLCLDCCPCFVHCICYFALFAPSIQDFPIVPFATCAESL